MTREEFKFQDIGMYDCEKSVTIEDIKEFEVKISSKKKLNIKLPDNYITWLIKYNGGRSKKDGCDFIDQRDSDGTLISDFYALKYGPDYDELYDSYETFLDRIPKELIPIACDPGGNQICLGVREGKYYGKIYFWNHENEAAIWDLPDDVETPWWDNVYLVANSFEEFINKLYRYELPEEYSDDSEKSEGELSSFKPKPASEEKDGKK
jgi:hypothetical protein